MLQQNGNKEVITQRILILSHLAPTLMLLVLGYKMGKKINIWYFSSFLISSCSYSNNNCF